MNTQSLLQPNINYNESTADEFNTAKAYSAGNYCIYNNILYKFTSDKAAGAWDSSKVTSTTVASEISSLNDNFANVKKDLNFIRNVDFGASDRATTTYTFPGNGGWLLISSHPYGGRGLYIASIYQDASTITTVVNDSNLKITIDGYKLTCVSSSAARLYGIQFGFL